MPKLSHVLRVVSSLKATRSVDGNEKKAGFRLPACVLKGDTAKDFAKAIDELLANNNAIAKGEPIILVNTKGEESAPMAAVEDPIIGKTPFPSTGLILTYADIVDAINAAAIAKNRNRVGAYMSYNFDKEIVAKRSGGSTTKGSEPVVESFSDDIEDESNS